ncbi:9864_t:CDS:1, partial [Scutellospora calospora]
MDGAFPGFSSGSGRHINPISEESINRIRGLFDDNDKIRKDSGSSLGFSSVTTPKKHSGFSSGSGRHVNPISEESINRIRGLFDDDEEICKDPGSLLGFSSVSTPMKLSGFSSGSGRHINPLSEESINRIRGLFDDDDEVCKDPRSLLGFSSVNTSKKLSGFSSDGGCYISPKKRKILHQNQNIINNQDCLPAVQPRIDYSEKRKILHKNQNIINSQACLPE